MPVTRAAQRRVQQAPTSTSSYVDYCRQQEKQLEADRAMIDTYRMQWQQSKGVGHALWRHVCDCAWWLMHVCGLNMVDYEERVILLLVFVAVLALIALGAYKQGTQLMQLLQQLATKHLRGAGVAVNGYAAVPKQ